MRTSGKALISNGRWVPYCLNCLLLIFPRLARRAHLHNKWESCGVAMFRHIIVRGKPASLYAFNPIIWRCFVWYRKAIQWTFRPATQIYLALQLWSNPIYRALVTISGTHTDYPEVFANKHEIYPVVSCSLRRLMAAFCNYDCVECAEVLKTSFVIKLFARSFIRSFLYTLIIIFHYCTYM